MAQETIRPSSSSTTSSSGTFTIVNPVYGYTPPGTYPPDTEAPDSLYIAYVTATGEFIPQYDSWAEQTYTGFSSKPHTWTSYEIKMLGIGVVSTVYDGTSGYTVAEYSIDSGSNWTAFAGGTSYGNMIGSGYVTPKTSGSISGNPTASSIQVRFRAYSYQGVALAGDYIVIGIADIWIVGDYTPTTSNFFMMF
jgi:hypothetical protein